MNLESIEVFLSKRTGVSIEIIGSQRIAKAVELRLTVCGLSDTNSYLNLLRTSIQEFEELVEKIVVPETWFFRDRKPFDFLKNHARTEWLKKPYSKIRLLSIPCSTGEEPYSIAMALLEAGLSPQQFKVDAIDISKVAITKAQKAIYGKNSFRGEDWVDRNRYFQLTPKGYEVTSNVRDLVHFQQGNLFQFFAGIQGKYDVIFCRNLLIYLNSEACNQAFNTFKQLLLPNGLLFVGSSEMSKVPQKSFQPIRESFTFAYQKITNVQPNINNSQPVGSIKNLSSQEIKESLRKETNSLIQHGDILNYKANLSTKSSNLLVNLGHSQTSSKATAKFYKNHNLSPPFEPSSVDLKSSSSKRSSEQNVLSTLELAQTLADSGEIEASIKYCQDYLACHSTSVKAYTLLGTLYQVKLENYQAEQCFQKALYLDPKCQEALVHLALLKEHRGDLVGAELLQQRLQKLQQQP